MNIPENFDRWMFDYMEGNLSGKEAESFEQFLLQNPEFEVDAEAWENAIIPATGMTYPNQQHLERKRKFAGWYSWSAAAILTLGILTGGYYAVNYTPAAVAFNKSQSEPVNSTKQLNGANKQNLASNHVSTQFRSVSTNGVNQPVVHANPAMQSFNNGVISPNSNNGFNSNSTSNGGINAVAINSSSENFDNQLESPDFDFRSIESNNVNNNGVSKAMKQAQDKLHTNEHGAQYKNNPGLNSAHLDLSKKSSVNFNSFGNKTKRIYRKIEKMFGYPVALVNLRDPELLMPENSLVGSNPGFAGGMLMPRFEMSYRNQWLGSGMNANKVRFSFDNYITDMKGGLGIAVNADTYGDGAFGDYSVDIAYSPKLSLGKNVVFEPGIKISLGAITGNSSKLEGTEALELDRGLVLENTFINTINQTEKLWYKDYGLGFVLNTTWFYAGFSADNLGKHYASVFRPEGNVEPMRTPVLYNGILGADYESRNKVMTFSPFISVRKFGNNTEAWAGMNYRLNHFVIGGSYSTKKDFTAAIGMKFKKFKLVYQYDRTHTLVSNEQIGSHNLGIRFNGQTKKARFK